VRNALLPAGCRVPVFETMRTSHDRDGTPFRVTFSAFPANRNQFRLEVSL
jgi:DNA-binding GntR family transcriptional regulator